MEAHVYDQFAELQERHFWFQGRRSIFFDQLDREFGGRRDLAVLEIGCGAGGMLGSLERYGRVIGLDIAFETMRHCKDRGFDRVVTGSGYGLPFADDSFDLVALFDVIEHIPDDVKVLEEVQRVLRPGGRVFISVPAYQFLYSYQDHVVHHLRRYTAGRLRSTVERAGLQVRKLSYFNVFLFPLIFVAVLVLKLKERFFGIPEGQTNLDHQFAAPVNNAFAGVMSSERLFLRNIDFPFGHSLFAVAAARSSGGR